ncbi:GGDEF domain-containing protein [Actinoplanes sp. NEAU-A12]|uniref:GGDEF domain-containing protein n=1 Tax=Actinoplanes sandaracinus TaxID=3045177 RepID=A0ABT6X0W0_9ACTN|nr:GGDEF domain-containing protein [Actinoplanes sandaracinus]MDI6105643.1 GGDEF domain-containing protein [Actinoplanes sandaracinus]
MLSFGVMGACFLAPWESVKTVLSGLLGVSATAATVVGVVRHRPAVRWPWYCMAIGWLLFAAGDVIYWVQSSLLGRDAFPSIADAFYLSSYPLLAVALLGLVRARRPGKDRPGLLDALVLSTGASMLSWVFLMEPYVRDSDLDVLARAVSLAYPAADLLLLAVLLRLTTGRGDQPPAYRLFVAATASMLVGDVVYGFMELTIGYNAGDPIDAAWMLMYAFAGAAALHPTMTDMSRLSPPVAEGPIGMRRLIALAVASLMAPAALIIEWLRGTEINIPVIVSGCVVLFLLVIARLHGLVVLLTDALRSTEVQATTDQLTGLANRRRFHTCWQQSLTDEVGPTALLYIDLDGFKPVNDKLGHDAGDAVLQAVADRLRGVVRAGDVVARLGGDEFAIILPWTDDRTAGAIAERIVQELALPFELTERTVYIGASVGVITATQGDNPNAQLRRADTAMYAAKNAGRGRVHQG